MYMPIASWEFPHKHMGAGLEDYPIYIHTYIQALRRPGEFSHNYMYNQVRTGRFPFI